ncbi:cytokine receptor family member b1 isoform X2 [Hoplias malabaricus]|uniref:cytokine receptor family member b1 isoform X2 n=1 Tax=Hoplias malabaricus TaxID=27720 RepID=UPI003461C135
MRIISLLLIYLMVLNTKAALSLPEPKNLRVVSYNFDHVVQWNPGKGTPPGTVYTMKIRGSQKARLQNLNSTIIDISSYMENIMLKYLILVKAFHGNQSSLQVLTEFTPISDTIIGPPDVTLFGCGNCLNISITLPKGKASKEGEMFYNGIGFEIHWKKDQDEKEIISYIKTTPQQTSTLSTYTHILKDLQPGEKYCLRAQPKANYIHDTLISGWFCAFTSEVQQRQVAYMAGWTVGFVLFGLGFLITIASLVYTGFLCKLKISPPKSLTRFVPSSYHSPETLNVSVVENGSCGKSSNPAHLHQIESHPQEEDEGNRVDVDNSDDDDGDDHYEADNDQHYCEYMDRASNDSDSQATNSAQSSASIATTRFEASLSGNSGGIANTEQATFNGITLSQLQQSPVSENKQTSLTDTRPGRSNPSKFNEAENEGKQMNRLERNTPNNINLLSVTLKSLEPEENKLDEASNSEEVSKHLLPSLLKELEEDRWGLSKPQTGKPLLLGPQTHVSLEINLQEDELWKQKRDQTQKGCIAMHTGRIDTENDCLLAEKEEEEEEEEEDCSGYMRR